MARRPRRHHVAAHLNTPTTPSETVCGAYSSVRNKSATNRSSSIRHSHSTRFSARCESRPLPVVSDTINFMLNHPYASEDGVLAVETRTALGGWPQQRPFGRLATKEATRQPHLIGPDRTRSPCMPSQNRPRRQSDAPNAPHKHDLTPGERPATKPPRLRSSAAQESGNCPFRWRVVSCASTGRPGVPAGRARNRDRRRPS